MDPAKGFEALRETLAVLLGQGGCEWDREQTHESLVAYLIEETYELVDAIESGDRQAMREELGDVLYQLLFHAEIARTNPQDPFDIDDVAAGVNEKMRRRHPHVFEGLPVAGVEDIKANWQAEKRREKPDRAGPLDGVSSAIQGLARAQQVVDRAAKAGHAVPNIPVVPSRVEEELGRWLLGVVAAARADGVDLDRALRGALREFEAEVTSPAPADPDEVSQ